MRFLAPSDKTHLWIEVDGLARTPWKPGTPVVALKELSLYLREAREGS